MKFRQIILITASALLLFIASCQEDNAKARLAFSANDSISAKKNSLSFTDFKFDSASMILENIKLRNNFLLDTIFETVEDSLDYWENLEFYSASFYGPYMVNLIEGTSSPIIEIVEVEPGIYNSIEAFMGNGKGDSVSFYLSGTAINNLQSNRFEFKYSYGSVFKLENPSGFEIIEHQTNVIWVKIDLNNLIEVGILENAEKDNDGIIRINKESNAELIDSIIQNLNAYSELGYDMNMDGEIDN
ncbi:MAG: hypothetical protein P1P82_01235 [Bacteroidales bacterium]|nr:hypothetical protein [Bacteroidales bacterium]MDT8431290.1 hypothetical protein [Bacteroidales bacterium]